ncbi:MAG TPA: hypothetical protein VG388_04490 [Solirubrobacteraceae bacterium]|jgi:hypothetical protein|nr:hypothetical protein [Solirubrobacteraceae bacterium]
MPIRRPLAVTLGVLALALLGGCGDSRTRRPVVSRIEPPAGFKAVDYLHNALHFDAPQNWAIETGSAPLVVTLGSGPAVIAIWRYPRSARQPLPATPPELEQARSALLAAAGARDPTFRVISSSVIVLGNVFGVELDALETVRGQVRRVRSTHLYGGGAELVVDEFAPEDLFHGVDRSVFSPLLHSVRLVA